MGRFDVLPVVRVHWRSLSGPSGGDWVSRAIFLAVLAVPAAAIWTNFRFVAAPSVLAAVALLAGALMGAFTHLSTLRLKVTDLGEAVSQRVRNQIDESAAHLLTAALLCALDALVLAVMLNLPLDAIESRFAAIPSAIAAYLTVYIFLLFVVVVRRMYAAYVDLNQVDDAYDGFKSK